MYVVLGDNTTVTHVHHIAKMRLMRWKRIEPFLPKWPTVPIAITSNRWLSFIVEYCRCAVRVGLDRHGRVPGVGKPGVWGPTPVANGVRPLKSSPLTERQTRRRTRRQTTGRLSSACPGPCLALCLLLAVPPNGIRPMNCEEQSVDRTTDKWIRTNRSGQLSVLDVPLSGSSCLDQFVCR